LYERDSCTSNKIIFRPTITDHISCFLICVHFPYTVRANRFVVRGLHDPSSKKTGNFFRKIYPHDNLARESILMVFNVFGLTTSTEISHVPDSNRLPSTTIEFKAARIKAEKWIMMYGKRKQTGPWRIIRILIVLL
jgi:hypothetical protein